jgi:hypothetical protein
MQCFCQQWIDFASDWNGMESKNIYEHEHL